MDIEGPSLPGTFSFPFPPMAGLGREDTVAVAVVGYNVSMDDLLPAVVGLTDPTGTDVWAGFDGDAGLTLTDNDGRFV